MVTWKDGATVRVLRSAAELRRAVAAGDATIRRTASWSTAR
jgi:hypothetical protein